MDFCAVTRDFNPEIFSIGNHAVRWYGFMAAMALFTGYLILNDFCMLIDLHQRWSIFFLVYIAIAAIEGARLGHCFFYEPDYFLKNPLEILKIWKGGMASHGWATGILLALWLYNRKYKIPFLRLMDRIVIVVALSCAFIRIGNFVNSEIYGLPTSLPWGVEFVRDRLYDSTTGEILPTEPRHQTQLYEAFSYFLIFIASFIFSVFMIALFSARFLNDELDNDDSFIHLCRDSRRCLISLLDH